MVNMKKILIALCSTVLFVTTAFAIDVSVGGNVNYIHAWLKTKTNNDSVGKRSNELLGVNAFFDAQYLTMNAGTVFTVGKTTASYKVGSVKAGPVKVDLKQIFVHLGLLGKYPFSVGIAKIYPIAGFEFDFNISATRNSKDLKKGKSAEMKKGFNRYYFSFGAGSDIYVMPKLFIRPTALFGIRMNNTVGGLGSKKYILPAIKNQVLKLILDSASAIHSKPCIEPGCGNA